MTTQADSLEALPFSVDNDSNLNSLIQDGSSFLHFAASTILTATRPETVDVLLQNGMDLGKARVDGTMLNYVFVEQILDSSGDYTQGADVKAGCSVCP